jgi:hypothetical protein
MFRMCHGAKKSIPPRSYAKAQKGNEAFHGTLCVPAFAGIPAVNASAFSICSKGAR